MQEWVDPKKQLPIAGSRVDIVSDGMEIYDIGFWYDEQGIANFGYLSEDETHRTLEEVQVWRSSHEPESSVFIYVLGVSAIILAGWLAYFFS